MVSRPLQGFFTVALAGALAAPSAPALAQRNGKSASAHGCHYYDDAGFQGQRAEILDGNSLSLGPDWSDKISSLTCHPLCTLTAYDGENQSGAKKSFTGDLRSIPAAWDDKISSMSVSCRRRVRSAG